MLNLKKQEYVFTIETINKYYITVESTTEDSAIEEAERQILDEQGQLDSIHVEHVILEEINDVHS
jgi:hypothetical protein